MNGRKTYIEIMKKMEFVLPSTVYLDYTKILPEELWERVYNLLEYSGCLSKMSDSELYNLRFQIIEGQRHIRFVHGNSNENKGFDQNNNSIKNYVLSMRFEIFETIKKLYNPHNSYFDNNKYNRCMGNVDEIKEYISEENVREYIMNLLTITKETNALYDLYYVVRDILLHYNFSGDNDAYEFISKLLDDAVNKSANFKGDLHSYGYDGVEHNSQRFNAEVKIIIDEIVNYIVRKANALLEKRIDLDRKSEYYNKEVSLQGFEQKSSDLTYGDDSVVYVDDDNSVVHVDDSKEEVIFSGYVPSADVEQKSLDGIDLDVMMSNYDKLLEIIEQNKKNCC